MFFDWFLVYVSAKFGNFTILFEKLSLKNFSELFLQTQMILQSD